MGFSHGPAKRRLGLSFTRLSLYKNEEDPPARTLFHRRGCAVGRPEETHTPSSSFVQERS